MKGRRASFARLLGLVLVSALALQLWFLVRIGLMAWVDPASTTFERSELWRLSSAKAPLDWHREWRDYDRISTTLKRGVVASEDAGFVDHGGIDWEALEKAWDRNRKAEARAEQRNERVERRAGGSRGPGAPPRAIPKLLGGSTITQQLAKNLFLAGERHLARKAEEAVLAEFLELLLGKRRILEIYLNHVEWGEGVFGAEAAAHRYFRVGADRLSPAQAARLAVMLPAPKRFEKRPASPYILERSATVQSRMALVEIP